MKIVIGMSGGVDSSVAALLLKEEGHDILGITLKLFDDDKTNEMINDSKKICSIIGIPHQVINLEKEFKEIVINNFINEYNKGFTPNPCVICNKYIKFGLMYQKAKELGYDYLATGHYINNKDGKLEIFPSSKDQSYFLYGIDKDIINHLVFPLNKFKNKDEIREYAKQNNLPVYNKKDSQEICFIKDDDYINFLNNFIVSKEGNIRHKNGEILGKHNGIYKYTIGQRKGLKIGYKEALYVIDINKETNEVIVGNNDDLFSNNLVANNINILVDKIPEYCMAKVRSRGVLSPCQVKLEDNKLFVTFKEKQRAITKGQSIVIYKDNILLGGGIIEKVF